MPVGAAFARLFYDRAVAEGRVRVDRSYVTRCRDHDIDGDLLRVRAAVSSLPVHPPQAFYVGGTSREPEDRFWNVGGEDRSSVPHHERWERMVELLEVYASLIAVREESAIEMYRGDPRTRNVSPYATGYSRTHERAFLYLCYGSAAQADRALR